MRKFLPIVLIATTTIVAFADEPSVTQKSARNVDTATPSENSVCPDSGDKVGSIGKPVYVIYQGKKIGLCCRECLKDFQKDPAKYSALAEKNSFDHTGTSMH
jgi:hypothetical protein